MCRSLSTTFHLTYFKKSLVFSTSMAMSLFDFHLPQNTDPWFVLKPFTIFFSLTFRQLEYTAYYYHVNFPFSASIVNSLHTINCDTSDISETLLTFLMTSSCLHQRAQSSFMACDLSGALTLLMIIAVLISLIFLIAFCFVSFCNSITSNVFYYCLK